MTQSLVQWEVERPDTRVITNNSICNKEKQKAWEKEGSEPTYTGKKATNRNTLEETKFWIQQTKTLNKLL